MSAEGSDGLAFRSYGRVIVRRKWIILGVLLIVTLLGTAYTWTRLPLYSASAKLLYTKPIDIQNPLGQSYTDTTSQQAEIEAVPAVIASSKVVNAAARLITPDTGPGYYVTATLQTGANSLYSNVVTFTGVSPDAQLAAASANAYAQAFINWGRDTARSQVAEAIQVVESRLNEVSSSSAEYESLKSSFQQLQLLQASAQGNFTIITDASTPSAPFSPDKKRGLILSLGLGLVLGLGVAFLLEQLDTRVHGEEQVLEALHLPAIGHVPPLPRKNRDGNPLITAADPGSPSAESYRVLRNNLEFLSVYDEVRSLMITSSVQGEGKSVAACNLAVSMAMAGRRVILVDADLRSPRIHQYMGIANGRGASTVIARHDDPVDALVTVSFVSGQTAHASVTVSVGRQLVHSPAGARGPAAEHEVVAQPLVSPLTEDRAPLNVLPSGPLPPNPGELVASRRFKELIETLTELCDLVIVDAPAMLPVGDTAALAGCVDGLVFVADPTKLKRNQLDRARTQLSQLPCRKLGVLVVTRGVSHGYYGYQ